MDEEHGKRGEASLACTCSPSWKRDGKHLPLSNTISVRWVQNQTREQHQQHQRYIQFCACPDTVVHLSQGQRAAKKQKGTRSSKQSKPKGKEKAFERKYISIPAASDNDLSGDDEALLNDFGDAINFLAVLDQQGMAR